MTKNIDIINSQVTQSTRWLTEQSEPSTLSPAQKQVLINKTNLLGKSQNLAAETRAILADLDTENAFNNAIEQDLSIPTLPAPQTGAKALNQNGKATELLSILMMLSSEVSLNELSLQLSNLMASYESYRKTSNELDKELEKYIDKAEQAKGVVADAEKVLEGVKDKLSEIQNQIREKQKEMSKMEKDSPEYKIAKNELNQLKQAEISAQHAVQDKTAILKENMKVAEKAVSDATKALEKQSAFAEQQGVGYKSATAGNTHRTNAARLSELIAYFMQLINKNSETELESQLSIFESMQKSVQGEMEKKANEIEEQEKKAEELQKTMGCIGKIIGAIVTVVSVVSAAFTGGASLALAGVGLALMAGDYITEAATGQSLTERVMAPFMEYIFLPLMGIVEKVVDKIFEYTPLGQLLNLIGDITGMDITGIAKTAISALATIALIVAVAYVAKSGAKAISEKLLGKTIGEALNKLVPKVTADLVKKVAQSLAKSINEVAAKAALKNKATAARALKLQKLMQYLSYGNQGAQVTGNVIVADFKEQAVRSMASFKISQNDLDNIKKVLESVISAFEHSQSTYRDLAKLISDSRHTESNTGKQVLSNMRI